jgi:hypothetical protein
LKSLAFKKSFDVCLTKFENYQILLNKISHRILAKQSYLVGERTSIRMLEAYIMHTAKNQFHIKIRRWEIPQGCNRVLPACLHFRQDADCCGVAWVRCKSLKQEVIEAASHQSSKSSKWQVIKAASHQSGKS